MNIVLLGAPGSGKGTQAQMMAEHYKLPHISTGEIFRYHIKKQTPIGIEAKKFIDKGKLVSDDITIEIVKQRISMDDCKNGYLLDGFPRTVAQAEAFEKISQTTAVINLNMGRELLLNRLTGRRVCSVCGSTYHIELLNGKTDCAECGGELVHRADDNLETVEKRLKVYESSTQPLIEYYTTKGNLIQIDARTGKANVFTSIRKALELI